MKRFLISLLVVCAFSCANIVMAEEATVETDQTKMEQFTEKTEVEAKKVGNVVKEKSVEAAKSTAEHTKSGAKKVGNVVKEKSVKAAKSTAKHTKSGAKKVGNATVRGANKATRATAKGVKKMGEKMQTGAEKTIEKTTKKLEATDPKKKCTCGGNCQCQKEECGGCETQE